MTVCSSAFEAMGRATAARLGRGALPIAVVPHPFGVLSREAIGALAGSIARDITRLVGAA